MAIQAQWYPNNSASPFFNNGYCAGGLIDSHVNFQHKHHQQQQQLSEQHLRELYNGNYGTVQPNLHVYNSKATNCPMFAVQLEKQREEIDQYIKFQNEELRYMLQEHGKQHAVALLKKMESRSLHILREKDEEIAQAVKKKLELEEYLRRLEAENIKWQKVAQEKETMALTLYKTLEEMTEGGYFLNSGVVANDAVSFCDETGEKEDMQEEATTENRVECGGVSEFEQIRGGVMLCKSCHSRSSCFLFLPCRHLSSCKVCNAFLEACPVCTTPKKATIELRL
ncbi:BOI-related E3 ubiquitin-protein ligase 3 [Spatholobus suberectus]|nr:BOI-related E3 ubiquitin-protein ligase 3 [Spatholobus suberectus]